MKKEKNHFFTDIQISYKKWDVSKKIRNDKPDKYSVSV